MSTSPEMTHVLTKAGAYRQEREFADGPGDTHWACASSDRVSIDRFFGSKALD